jgi:hypothetical protein
MKSSLLPMIIPGAMIGIISAVGALTIGRAMRVRGREGFIRDYAWPPGLLDKLGEKRPDLIDAELQLVGDGLRQFFVAYLMGGQKYVSMPSQVVDDLWHEFILYTRAYDAFCKRGFGGYFHHTPALALAPQTRQSNEGLRRVWRLACKQERIDPLKPAKLPLLFALDAMLNIPGGFHYAPDCTSLRESGVSTTPYCAGHFSSSSYDGSTSGMESSPGEIGTGSDGNSGHGDSGHSGSGCGSGSGCSGGGCGGGD